MKKTEQEKFWSGKFGIKYTKRNTKDLKSRIFHFRKIFKFTKNIESVYEIGTNRGLNLDAIKEIKPKIKTFGIEINKQASSIAKKKHNIENASIFEKKIFKKFDLVFTRAVLIHINPNKLSKVYEKINKLSQKYILIDEFFNPVPIKMKYRGYNNKLFKRDFAFELMKKYNLKIIDYGFGWSKDPRYPQVDSTWFLFKK